MTKRTPRAEVDIRGTQVGFLRRDIRQITDRERGLVERLVESEQRDAGVDRRVARITIETDYADPERLVYRVEVQGKETDAASEESECAGSSEPDGC